MSTVTIAGIDIDVDSSNAILCAPDDLPKLIKHMLSTLPDGTSQLDLHPCRDVPGRFMLVAFNDIDSKL